MLAQAVGPGRSDAEEAAQADLHPPPGRRCSPIAAVAPSERSTTKPDSD